MRIPLRVPSGSRRGMKKQDRPVPLCASTRCASHCGAEKNHLCPVMRYEPSARAPGARGIGAHVRAALLFGHAHADQSAALALDREDRAHRIRG